MLYSTKNYLFPDEQFYPHSNWQDSVMVHRGTHPQETFLRSLFPYDCSTTLGPPSGDHVFLFSSSPFFACMNDCYSVDNVWVDVPLKDKDPVSANGNRLEDDFTCECCRGIFPGSPVSAVQPIFCEGGLEGVYINVMMYDMKPEVATLFYNDGSKTAEQVTVRITANCEK